MEYQQPNLFILRTALGKWKMEPTITGQIGNLSEPMARATRAGEQKPRLKDADTKRLNQ